MILNCQFFKKKILVCAIIIKNIDIAGSVPKVLNSTINLFIAAVDIQGLQTHDDACNYSILLAYLEESAKSAT